MIHKEQIYIFQAIRKNYPPWIGYFEETKWTIRIVNSRRTDKAIVKREGQTHKQ